MSICVPQNMCRPSNNLLLHLPRRSDAQRANRLYEYDIATCPRLIVRATRRGKQLHKDVRVPD
eukprot:scaffold69097_cov30-Prasinocladus_malaysianus.AAC.2